MQLVCLKRPKISNEVIYLVLTEEEDENPSRTEGPPWAWTGGPGRAEERGGAAALGTNLELRTDPERTGGPGNPGVLKTSQEESDAKTGVEEVWFWGKSLRRKLFQDTKMKNTSASPKH